MTARSMVILAAALAIVSCGKAPVGAESLEALDSAYVAAWLENDPEAQEAAVLSLFDRDAVIMPGGGVPPSDGLSAVRAFWFPDKSPPTIVTLFTHDIDRSELSGDLGVVSGRYELHFDFDGESYAQTGNYLIVARREGAKWLITRMIWNDKPKT